MAAAGPALAVGAIVFDAAGRVLLVKRGREPARGKWSVPGGRVEAGETVREACRREVLEETGLEVELGDLACWLERITPGFHYVILDFVAWPVPGAPTEPRAGSDADEARWYAPHELAGLDTTAGLLDVIADARRLMPG